MSVEEVGCWNTKCNKTYPLARAMVAHCDCGGEDACRESLYDGLIQQDKERAFTKFIMDPETKDMVLRFTCGSDHIFTKFIDLIDHLKMYKCGNRLCDDDKSTWFLEECLAE